MSGAAAQRSFCYPSTSSRQICSVKLAVLEPHGFKAGLDTSVTAVRQDSKVIIGL